VSKPAVLQGALLPALGGLAGIGLQLLVLWLQGRSSIEKDAAGRLKVDDALTALQACVPNAFDGEELKRRRNLNKQLDKVATTIETIPATLASREPALVIAAQSRAAAIRYLQVDAASLTVESKERLRERLSDAKRLFDSGQWMDLPAAEVVDTTARPIPVLHRVLYGALAIICFGGILAVVAFPSHLSTAVASLVTLVLGALLLASLGKAGLLTQTVQQAVELTTKAQGTIKFGGDAKPVSASGSTDPH
jgi:hypothetical protein